MNVKIESNNIPNELRKNNNWVSQKLTWNDSKNKYEKKPLNARTGRVAKWSNPEEWASFEEVETMQQSRSDIAPAYIMQKNDNLVCIDLDDCYDGTTLKPYAEYLINLFQSYTERSVSGNGIHIFCQGTTDLKTAVTIEYEGAEYAIEIFTKKRIITMTGVLINDDYADIEDGMDDLENLNNIVKPKTRALVRSGMVMPSELPLDKEQQKLESALKSIDPSAYSDWVNVGMALRLWGAQEGAEEVAWALFDTWSASTDKGNYDQEKNLKTWGSWSTEDNGEKQVTLGSVFHMAKEAGWTFDSRQLSSALNGQQGGRPPAPPHAETAQDFFEKKIIEKTSGFPKIRYRQGQWFEYSALGWAITPREEIMSRIATFMQNKLELQPHCSSNYFRSVRDNLTSYNMCATGHQMPTWLDSGKSADHWMAFSDGVAVNMLKLAEVKAGLAEGAMEEEYKRPISPAFFSKSFVDYPLETENRSMPLFRKYLNEVQPDEGNQRMLQQMAGLALTDETAYETCHALIGSGANGKTVFLDILQNLVGRKNVCFIPLNMITERFQGFPLAENKLNICNEMATDTGMASLHLIEGMLKECISGGDIEVERKGVDKTFAPCRARFIFSCNSMPTFVDRSDGIWRRLRVIDFPVTVPAENRDVHLAKKVIASELPGVLLWALEGLIDLLRNGSVFESETSLKLKNQHRLDCDKEKSFLHECCCVGVGAFVPKEILYSKYTFWCQHNGYRFPLSKQRFLKRIEEIHPMLQTVQKAWEASERTRGYDGLGLQEGQLDFDDDGTMLPSGRIGLGAKAA